MQKFASSVPLAALLGSPKREKACKGTTKNAYVQIFCEKVYFLMRKSCAQAALSERSFGGMRMRRRRPKVQPFRSMRGRSPHNSQPLQALGYCFVVFRRYRDGFLIWYIQFGGDHTLFVTAKHFDVIRVNVVASLATQQTMLLHQFFE